MDSRGIVVQYRPNNVVVMDNASYQTKIRDPVPTKSKMCEYWEYWEMNDYSIMRKTELFELAWAAVKRYVRDGI